MGDAYKISSNAIEGFLLHWERELYLCFMHHDDVKLLLAVVYMKSQPNRLFIISKLYC